MPEAPQSPSLKFVTAVKSEAEFEEQVMGERLEFNEMIEEEDEEGSGPDRVVQEEDESVSEK